MTNVNFKVGQLVRVWNFSSEQEELALIVKIVPHPSSTVHIDDAHVSLLLGEKVKLCFYGDLKHLNG